MLLHLHGYTTRVYLLHANCGIHVRDETTAAVLDAMSLVHDDVLPEVTVQVLAIIHRDLERRDHDRLNLDPWAYLVPTVDLAP